ncbi:ATP-binding protein [Streptomyces sp. NPDC007264]|uniref:sensor histidine kinase n=1 Tax=Streptomyces sp. NPDC007264 TaxID=3364777 RepID=UPI0036DF4D11
MTAPTPSGERPAVRAVAPASLATAVVAGLAVTAAVMAAPEAVRVPLAWGGAAAALLLCVAVGFAVHGARAARVARRRLDAVAQDASRMLQERARLAEEFSQERGRLTDGFIEERVRLSEEFERERARLAQASAQERERLTDGLAQERAALTEGFAQERERLTADIARLIGEKARLTQRLRQAANTRDAAISVTANVAGRMQALATGTLADLRAMEDRHTDEDVLTDLLYLDHRTAQAGRLADSVAVLAGARSGRRWARPIVMESILRGAMGRISGYQRVRLHSSSEAAVAGHAAEGVMHALAELLDNAATFSPPTAEVHVYVEEVPAGVIVSVEDAGLVMSDVQLRRAERAVSGDITELGGLTGTRLGLAVVGRLARKYGLRVSFRPSARGGTGVLMLIPQEILSQPTLPSSAEPGHAHAQAAATGADITGPNTVTPNTDDAIETAAIETAAADAATTGHRPSYAAAHAPQDLDPDPVPTHESPASDDVRPGTRTGTTTDAGTGTGTGTGTTTGTGTGATGGGLPRRRRGQALAAAERGRAHTVVPAPREPLTAKDAKTRAARFSSFRQAVRGVVPDQAAVQGTTAEPPATESHASSAARTPHEPAEGLLPDASAPGRAPDPTAVPEPAATPSHPEGKTTS